MIGLVALADRPEHDPAARRPGQLGVIDPVALAVHDGLLEPEGIDEEFDECAGVAAPDDSTVAFTLSRPSMHGIQPASAQRSSARRRSAVLSRNESPR